VKRDRGSQFPGVRGKVVKWVETVFEEGLLFIHVRFTDQTELGFTITSRLIIEEADLKDWKTGDGVRKRTYIQSPEMAEIAAQEPEFRRICKQLGAAKRKGGSNG
jgi:hypothetical protein